MKQFSEILNSLEGEELSPLLDRIHRDPLPPTAANRIRSEILYKTKLTKHPRGKVNPLHISRRAIAAIAVSCLLLICVGCGTYVYAAEVREYNNAVQFFDAYGLPTEGLTRGEIKAVYRDITAKSFSYSKTAEVIESSLSSTQISGYEIIQENPSPEEVKNLWDYKNLTGQPMPSTESNSGIHYEIRSEYKLDSLLGFDVHDKTYLEKYEGETLIWSVPFTEFWFYSYSIVTDGVIVYGETDTWSSEQISHAWMAKVDQAGNVLWKHMLDNGFEDEYIAAILENDDGSYAVISRGDLNYFCLSQYSADGEQLLFRKTEIGNYGIWNAVRFGDGYLVQLGSYMTNEHARIVRVDQEGNITDSFSYGSGEAYYYITDMIEFDGKIYLSAYAVPKHEDEDHGRYEIAEVLNYIFDNNMWNITSEELTPMVRDHYTAMLLVCDPKAGTPQEFYSVKGSLGSGLSVNDSGSLLWDVESITSTFFSPATSSFTIGGTSHVYRYTFDASGTLINQEKTGQITDYRR